MLPCPSKSLFGIECPGCGIQRSADLLLKGKIIESVKMYPALIPALLMVVFVLLHLKFKFKNGAKILLWMNLVILAIVLINYAAKFIR